MFVTNRLYSGLAIDVAAGASSSSQHDGGDGKLATSVTNNNLDRVKRPMNPSMVCSKGQLPNMTQENPRMEHSDVSQRQGAEWNFLTAAERGPFVGEANRLKAVLMGEHLDYTFTSKPKESACNRPGAGQQNSGHQELQVPNYNMSDGGDSTGSYHSMSTQNGQKLHLQNSYAMDTTSGCQSPSTEYNSRLKDGMRQFKLK